jgi:hypothetical protein
MELMLLATDNAQPVTLLALHAKMVLPQPALAAQPDTYNLTVHHVLVPVLMVNIRVLMEHSA